MSRELQTSTNEVRFSLEFLRANEKTRDSLRDRQTRIWSDEHKAYWRQNKCGYTEDKNTAGIYPFFQAWGMIHHAGQDKQIVFELVN